MILTPEEAKKLSQIWNALYDGQQLSADLRTAFNNMEDLRPAGGFREYIDKKFCKECGRLLDDTKPESYGTRECRIGG